MPLGIYRCECGAKVHNRTCTINTHNKTLKHQHFLTTGEKTINNKRNGLKKIIV